MGKKAAWSLAIFMALVAVAGLFVHAGLVAHKSPPSSTALPGPAPAAVAPAAPPAVPEPSPATASELPKRQMQMAETSKAFTPSPTAVADYSYSLKQQRNERTILPGVTVGPGKAVSVKTANKDEIIRITRDSTYGSSDYQVMWQKKY